MTTADTNTRVKLALRPDGRPERSDFDVVEEPVPSPGAHEVLVRTRFLSVDPYMAEQIRGSWSVGEVPPAPVVGEVIESNTDVYEPGDVVTGSSYLQELEWAEYVVAGPSELQRVDTGQAPVSTALGVLGMPGRTAYFGMLDVGDPKPGETVVVSGAAGAVGSVAGQIARLAGGRVVGIAGSGEKVAWLTEELGFSEAVNYRSVDDLGDALGTACPDGVDVYFDNVGGTISDAVVDRFNNRARLALCGQVALYNQDDTPHGPRLLPRLHTAHASVTDFRIRNYTHRFDEAAERLQEWVTAGDVAYRETITDGLENAPEAFLGLFEGQNTGKQLVRDAP